MAATPRIVITKSMGYKGTTREWDNNYHFTGGYPSGSTPATTFMDAVVADEADATHSGATIVKARIYPAGSDVADFTKVYSTSGGYSPGSDDRNCPGEVAALLRYTTTQVTSKNHPIYLFNYFHRALYNNAVGPDTISSGWKTALEEYGTDWIAGYSDGTNTYVRAGPNGAVAQARSVAAYLTHRDFPT
jgi:hypothetical protein